MAAAVLLLACAPMLALAISLFANIQAGLEELLPPTASSVRALNAIHSRLGGKAHVTVVVQSPDPAANRRFIDLLTARLTARQIPEARSIQGSVAVERAWIREHAALLLPQAKFDQALSELERAMRDERNRANPLFAGIDEDAPAPPWQEVESRLDAELRTADRFPTGYLEMPDGKTVVMLIWLQGSEVDIGPSERLMKVVHQEVATLRTQFDPGLIVAYTGEVPNLIEEHDAILSDLSISSLIVFLLVGALIVGYFRSPRSVLVVLIGLLPGLVFSFGIGRLIVGHLNSNTAFLGSIIAGNGINYPLLFLAYYRARPTSEPMGLAIRAAARNAFPGTLGAALTASAAYGGLAASTFKGFSQFGWLGGAGMLTTWALTFIATPIGIALLNPPRQGERPTLTQERMLRFFSYRLGARAAAGAVLFGVLVVALLGARNAVRGGVYEMNIQVLRNRESLRSGSGSWDQKMNELFGVWLNPVAALVEHPSEREALATSLRDGLTEAPPPVAERVETIEEFVPPLDVQHARIERLRKLSPELQRASSRAVSPAVRQLVDSALSTVRTGPIAVLDVPQTLRQSFEETSGRSDRVILVYPSLRIDYNDGRNLLYFEDRLSRVELPPGAIIGGGFLFMAAIIRLIRDEAPRVVLFVGLLVGLVLIPFFLRNPLRLPFVLLIVALVALVSQAVMLGVGVRINMLNFAAVPITIGVGSDYVVNLFAAMDVLGVHAREACARMGGAILLCSLTTVVGYLSLVAAQSGALRSFGWAAVLGELMAVTAVLLILPAFAPSPAALPIVSSD